MQDPSRTTGALATARRLADELLFPGALATDRADVVPVERLDALAEAGLYGLFGPPEAGGLGAGSSDAGAVTEALAGGCLTTAFVWAQHHHLVRALAAAPAGGGRDQWLAPLCRGDLRAGVAFAGLRRPGPPVLTATPVAGGWRLDGFAPWVTGWGRIDVVHVGARHGPDVVWAVVDARSGPSLSVDRLALAAVNASATVTVSFRGHHVAAERVSATESFADWEARDAAGLRFNASHVLGVIERCLRLLDEAGVATTALSSARARVRAELDGAAPGEMPVARARAAALAVRVASALVAAGGGRSVTRDHHAQRLAREAMFLLVFGQTPAIRLAQLDQSTSADALGTLAGRDEGAGGADRR